MRRLYYPNDLDMPEWFDYDPDLSTMTIGRADYWGKNGMTEPDAQFWATKRVCVTGGTGFLGWHVVQQLLPLARHVRILGLPPKSKALTAHLKVHDCNFGDVREPATVRAALDDCDVVFHTAGTVAMWGPALALMNDIHITGTRQVVAALPAHARLVHTSSVVAIGASRGMEVLTEASPFNLQDLRVDYVHAKKHAEDIALDAARRGRDVVVVNPGYLLGPEDYEISVMGRFCLRAWKGRVPLIPPGGLNFVDVRDAARGHILAAERGQCGARYILGGENHTLVEMIRRLAEVRGTPPGWSLRMPSWLEAVLAYFAEMRAELYGRQPFPSRQHVRLNRYHWYYSAARAETELGFRARPVMQSLHDAFAWFCQQRILKLSKPSADSIQPSASRRAA